MRSLFLFLVLLFVMTFAYAQESASDKTDEDTIDVITDQKAFSKGYIERQIMRYESLTKEYQKELRSLIRRNIEEKKRQIEEKYSPVIAKAFEKESANRRDAITLFENFIKKYPDNEKYTPGAMYRLAELYFERSAVLFEDRTQEYEKAFEAFEDKVVAEEPVAPVKDFSDSVRLYEEIINRFPSFQYLGAVYYMLGYCLEESGNGEKAVKVWLELIDKKIETPYLAELYLRIGDYYFRTNDLLNSQKYYETGLAYKESDLFDKILYKLAWTYYRQSKYQQAIDTFTSLILFADEMKKKGIDKGQELRKEALQYIAISYADFEWGHVDKAIDYFQKINGGSFEKEVFEQLGKYYFENNNFAQAEKAYRFILGRHPYYENAPRIHHKLIQLYNKAREFDKATAEIEIFAKQYDSAGEWARINRGNATAVREASEWAKSALLDTASFHHRQAQVLKEKGEKDASLQEYRIAAINYGEYLVKFPYTSDSYDITYNFADTLFQSGDIEMAVVIYERIRDDRNQDRLKEDAAYQTFVCYNMLWDRSPEKNIKSEEKRDKPFSALEEKLIQSSDIYFETAKEITDKPVVAYMVAKIFFDHGKFEEAEKRYLKIISEFSDSQAAVFSARDIISAYTEKKDWINVAKWSKLLTDRLSEKEKVSKEVKAEFTTYRAGALFNYAMKLEEEGKHKEAAAEYLKLVEENPYNQNADKALSNAAINFQRATMFESALQLHERIYKEYPYSSLAPQSLYLVAYNAEMSYDFEKAVNAYKLLYDKYPTYEKKSEALFNAGLLLERLQKYREAAVYYKMFYSEEKNKIEGKEALFTSGMMYEKAKDWQGMIKSQESFIQTFRSDPEVGNLVMRAYHQIATVYEDKLNNWKLAKEYHSKILEYLEESRNNSDESLLYAAEAKYKLIEDDYEEYLKMKIDGKNEKQLEINLKKKVEVKNKLEERYTEVLKFQVYEWVLASIYKIGTLYQSFSDALFSAAPPKGLTVEEEEIYAQMLREQAEPIEEAAVAKYTMGLEKARELKQFNKWTQLIIEKLSVMRPAEYKVGKIPKYATRSSLTTGFPVMLSLDKTEKKTYLRPGMDKKDTQEKTDGQEKGESK